MDSLLSSVREGDVSSDPFPHLIIKDAIDDELSRQLLREFPPLGTVTGTGEIASNQRFSLPASEAVEDPSVSALWKDFIRANTSAGFLGQLIDLFGDHIQRVYPNFERDYGSLQSLRAGTRLRDSFDEADVLLDAQISLNTPVTGKPSSVRRGHIDNPSKLFAGLFYLRSPDDDSTGGDLELYRFKSGPRGLRDVYVPDRFVEPVETVKYDRNVLVLFLNSIRSLHGVTVRSQTTVPRYFVNLVGEVSRPLFSMEPYQATWRDKAVMAPDRILQRIRA
jgi:hypothetical protein